ncbi:MAG: nicotinate-nucleotide adenylyltransferase [Clostridia bacterium]|nr:nicotinate-nucleotide adenylyltransferase [Clostridia bacterium]
MLYNKRMKIGIYGGTFDPIHLGHIEIAKAVRDELGLDRVLFVIAADPPHKHDPTRTPAAVRFDMAKNTLRRIKGLFASDIEIKRGGVSYTAETLADYKKRHPKDELFFIMGADMLASFHTWYHPELILKNAVVAAVQRTGQSADLEQLSEEIVEKFGGRIVVSNACGPEISSTEIRNRMLDAKPINDLINYETELFIYENRLYMPESLRAVSDKLACTLDPSRMRHSLLTVREAILLADHYGLDTEKARLCALVHDCGKLRGEALEAAMKAHDFVPTPEEEESPYLIHARLGAIIAETEYGVSDPEILTAIERHTLAGKEMTPFDEVIFLADKLEPTRDYRKINSIRKLAYRNMDAAVAAVIESNTAYNLSRGAGIHPSTYDTLEFFKTRSKNKTNDTKEAEFGK